MRWIRLKVVYQENAADIFRMDGCSVGLVQRALQATEKSLLHALSRYDSGVGFVVFGNEGWREGALGEFLHLLGNSLPLHLFLLLLLPDLLLCEVLLKGPLLAAGIDIGMVAEAFSLIDLLSEFVVSLDLELLLLVLLKSDAALVDGNQGLAAASQDFRLLLEGLHLGLLLLAALLGEPVVALVHPLLLPHEELVEGGGGLVIKILIDPAAFALLVMVELIGFLLQLLVLLLPDLGGERVVDGFVLLVEDFVEEFLCFLFD